MSKDAKKKVAEKKPVTNPTLKEMLEAANKADENIQKEKAK